MANPNPVRQGGELRSYASPESMARWGNGNGKTHSLYAVRSGNRVHNRRVSRLAAKVREALTWIEPSDEPAIRAWSQLEIMSAEVFAVLQDLGPVNDRGEVRRLLGDWRLLKQTQLQYERELAMTPASRAAILGDVSKGRYFDTAAAIAEERQRRKGAE